MSEHNIAIAGGSSVRLPTGGKYCDRDIVIVAEPGGVELPDLDNPGDSTDLMAGKQLIDGEGRVVDGTFTITEEITEQNSLINQIRTALKGKAAGSGGSGDPDLPTGYRRVDFIQFSEKQVVDTGIICNKSTKLQLCFSRERSSQHYLYGVASSDNTASVTAYLGGSWRFGNKYVTKTITNVRSDMLYTAIVSNSEISTNNGVSSISNVNDFETVGSLQIGGCRGSDGKDGAPQFAGKILFFAMWSGDEMVLKLIPVTDGTAFRFWDTVGKKFHDSITSVPLEGGNL